MTKPFLPRAKRHLAIFLPSLNGGGAEAVLLALAKCFSEMGIRCDLIVARSKGELIDKAPRSVRLIKLKHDGTAGCSLELARYLRREQPDAVLSSIFKANVRALLARIIARSHARIVIRESNPIEHDTWSPNIWRKYFDRAVVSMLYPTAHAAICVSDDVRKSLSALKFVPQSKQVIIRNPIIDCVAQGDAIVDKSRPIILACGRLESQKDHATLLRAFARVRRSRNVQLVLLGSGSLKGELVQQAEELGVVGDVQFRGFVSNPFDYMLQANVFVHTSRYEGCSNVLLQALAAKCPIVATDCHGGVGEMLAGGRYGVLVPVGDDRSIAKAIIRILDGEARPVAEDDYLGEFDIDRIAVKYLSVLFD